MYPIIFIIIVFLAGLYFFGKYGTPKLMEGLTDNKNNVRCPNVLIQKGSQFYLYNSSLAEIPGVNPIAFQNLEEYVEFTDWQRSQGIRCPVLYLQNSYDAQGNRVYKVRPSVNELQGGLPPSILASPNPTLLYDATQDDKPYNINSIPAYDATSQYVGATTPLDTMDKSNDNLLFSPNPMDDKWGGQAYTQALVDKGYYKDNEVNIYVP